jgi:rhodanese-related sulfurtransferase
MSDALLPPETLRQEQATGGGPVVLDVRGPDEYAAGHLPGAINVPAEELPSRLAEIPRDRPVVAY